MVSGRKKTLRPPAQHEAFVFSGGSLVRDGRFMSLQTTSDPAAHKQFVDAALARMPEVQKRLDDQLVRLRDILLEAGPAQLVAFASLTYLQKDPDSYRESEDDRSAAHLEFLALRALPILDEVGTSSAQRLSELTAEALHVVRRSFKDTLELLALSRAEQLSIKDSTSSQHDYRYEAQIEGLLVRGTAFAEHTKIILDGLFGPFDADCRRVLGFTADEAWRLLHSIPAIIGRRLDPRLREAEEKYSRAVRDIKRLRRKGLLPDHVAALTPTVQRAWLRRRIFGDAYSDSKATALLTPEVLAVASGVSTAAAGAWLELLHCPPSEYVEAYHHKPVGGHPITRKPILKVEGG